MSRRAPRRFQSPDDRGSSLIIVLVTMTVLIMFATVALRSTVGTLKFTDRQEDWNQAFSAAEAGIADYLARLNRDENYWRTVDCTNVALKKRMTAAAAPGCNWQNLPTSFVGWAQVPGSTTSSFHYDADVTSTLSTGAIVLRSTGKVGNITRTAQVRLRRDGFGEFLYYTMYETIDPANKVQYADTTKANTECTRYAWASPSRTSYCPIIVFTGGDVINGPLHSNDTMMMSNNGGASPRFRGTTTTSRPQCMATNGVSPPATSCYGVSGSSSPTFDRGIAFRPVIELPTSIGDLKQYVVSGANPRGCLYTGPTRIKFLTTAAGATPKMRVWSRASTSSTGLTTACGGSDLTRLSTGNSVDVNVPQNTVIYVQDIPSGNTIPSCLTAGNVGDGLPVANDLNLEEWDSKCQYGTAWVEGPVTGRVTLTTDNNIIVTGNLTYAGGETGTDSLGLVAKNSVKIYHPVRCTARDSANLCTAGTDLTGTKTDITVQAAILTLQHSFTVQSYYLGSTLNYFNVFGSISQRFRGPVGRGTGSSRTGYLKNYVYDTRLRYAPPPYFLDPVKSSWGQKTYGEIAPLY